MTPLIKEMVKLTVNADLDPTQMNWFDVTGAIKTHFGAAPKKYLLHPAPYKKMMLCGNAGEGNFMLSVTVRDKTTIVGGWILNKSGFRKLGAFLLAEHNGEPHAGEFLGEVTQEDVNMMCGIVAMFYASLDTKVESYVLVPHQANISRAKRGLKLLYEWRTAVIEPSKSKQEHQGGTHASPRRHQARGHWRNYKSGKRVWIKECWRGDASKGSIFKDYLIKGQQ